MAVGDYQEARKVLHQLIREHPRSHLVEDARRNVILSYYQEGNYSAAINYAGTVLQIPMTPHQKSRIYNLMGQSHLALGEYRESINRYVDAYALAEPRERADIMSSIKEVITYLEEPDLLGLLDVYPDRMPGGYLRLQLARTYAARDQIDLALKVLADFMNLFPLHEELETARAFTEELKSRELVARFSIGCILPLSGPYGTFGNRALAGIELALNQFNARTDVSPVKLLIKDSQGNQNEAANAVESLVVKDRVIGIIGPMITSESAAIKAQALNVPIMTLTQKPDITKLGDCVFRNYLTPSLQAKAVAAYVVQDLGIRNFAILYPEERYGISLMNRFWDELLVHGGRVVGIESYGLSQTDFADPIKKLVGMYYPRPEEPESEATLDLAEMRVTDPPAEGPDETSSGMDRSTRYEEDEPKPIIDFGAVFIPDSFEKVGLIAPQFPYYDVTNVLLLGTNLWHSDELIHMAEKYVQGAIVPEGFFVESPSPKVQDFVRSFEEVFGSSPGFVEAQAYDAASILFHLVNQPGVLSRYTLKLALMEVRDFPGITGVTSFDETGDVDKQIYLLQIRGPRFVQLRP